jgi:predicted short-subunit dehydrogenase-like oxidoreductase (DUF2520 family)
MPSPLSDLTLSCIGAGRLGKTLCRLFSEHLSIGQIVNSSQTSADLALDFIGAGTAQRDYANLQPADIWLIATPDNHIAKASAALENCGVLRDTDIVFHCSGSLTADALGLDLYSTASVHPIHSFANPDNSLAQFAGTACAVEGQPEACIVLEGLFAKIGGRPFAIQTQHKSLYHAATVMTCNYLVSLMALGEQMLNAAGVDLLAMDRNPLEPLIRQTVDNYLSTDAISALTGPIARGDNSTVEAHLLALQGQPDLWQTVYRAMGNATLELSAHQGQACADNLAIISNLLNSDNQ